MGSSPSLSTTRGRVTLVALVSTLVASAAVAAGSTLELAWTSDGGRLRFADLVHATDDPDAPGPPIDLEGTIDWTC